MHVESLAGAHVAKPRLNDAFGAAQILGCGDLEIVLAAGDQPHRETGVLGYGGIVGQIGAREGVMGRAVGGENLVEAKALRRLRPPQRGAVERLGNDPLRAALHRVVDGQRGDGAVRILQRPKHAVEHGAIEEGARRVMNEDLVGARGTRL